MRIDSGSGIGSYPLLLNSFSTTADVWVEGPDGVKYEDGFKRTSTFNEECVSLPGPQADSR